MRTLWTGTTAGQLCGLALLLAGVLLTSCVSVRVSEDSDDARAPLESASYLTENTREGSATLEDGEFREQAAPGSATEVVIRLGKWSLGDIDGQGALDAAAITVEDPGGSGTFRYLHALIKDDDDLRDAGVAFLGDRIRIEGVSVHAGVITVATLDRRPDEPFAAPPSVPVIRQFRLQGEQLTEVSGSVFACDATLAEDASDEGPACEEDASDAAPVCDSTLPDAALVIVFEPGSGASVSSGFGGERLLAHVRVERQLAAARSQRRGARRGIHQWRGLRRAGRVQLHGRVRERRAAARAPRGVRAGRIGWRGLPAAARHRAAAGSKRRRRPSGRRPRRGRIDSYA